MDTVFEVLTQAASDNLQFTVLMDVVVGFLFLFNILLGTIIGANNNEFNAKKLLFGVLKALAVLLIIIGVCYILNVFTLTINLMEEIEISTKAVSAVELLTIMVTQGIDLAKEVLDKISTFRDLKYISYDDVKPITSDLGVVEPSEERG